MAQPLALFYWLKCLQLTHYVLQEFLSHPATLGFLTFRALFTQRLRYGCSSSSLHWTPASVTLRDCFLLLVLRKASFPRSCCCSLRPALRLEQRRSRQPCLSNHLPRSPLHACPDPTSAAILTDTAPPPAAGCTGEEMSCSVCTHRNRNVLNYIK